MNEFKRIYGIDLGTTYSCISYVDENGKPVIIRGDGNRLVTPSVVYFETEDNVVVGDVAKDFALVSPDNTVQFVKHHMGEEDWEFEVFGKEFRAEQISAIILEKLVKLAEAETGDKVTDVVITVPAYFNAAQRTATEQAGMIAGLNVRALIPEPTAAAIAYSVLGEADQTVLVYDLGGGTFDVTVINVSQGKIEVLCTDGDMYLGGHRWDEAIVDYLVRQWQDQSGKPDVNPLDDLETAQSFRNEAEKAKRTLTERETAPIMLHHDGAPARVSLTRDTFAEITAQLLETTLALTGNVIKVAEQKGYGHISKILLVGGSTYMPQVRSKLEADLQIPTELFDPDQSVAKGAAVYASNKQIQELYDQAIRSVLHGSDASLEDLSSEEFEEVSKVVAESLPSGMTTRTAENAAKIKIINVCSKTFGTIALNSASNRQNIYYLIKKDSQVPADVEESFYTLIDRQQFVRFRVIESNGDNLPDTEELPPEATSDDPHLPSHSSELDAVTLKLPPDLSKGSPISVRYFLSEDGGRLMVWVQEPSSGWGEEKMVMVTNALTEEEIDEFRDVQMAARIS